MTTETAEREETALAEAIRRAGSGAALGRELGVGRKAVAQWKRVPMRHVERVHELYGIAKRRLLAPHLGTRG